MLELAILGLLKEQPLHGYELKKRLGDTLGFLWGVSYGSLYPALRRLERAGAIEIAAPRSEAPAPAPMPATGSIDGETAAARIRRLPKPTRRTRKQYRLTPRGEELFAELLTGEDAPGAAAAGALSRRDDGRASTGGRGGSNDSRDRPRPRNRRTRRTMRRACRARRGT